MIRRTTRMLHWTVLLILPATTVWASAASAELFRLPTETIANGKMTICWKTATLAEPQSLSSSHVLIHFHGSDRVAQAAFERTHVDAVLVTVNFPGLSRAYSQPFADNAKLFEQILSQVSRAVNEKAQQGATDWKRISLSSFSAGYGAVREILKTPAYFRQIDDIVAADSIYAGISDEKTRTVDPQNMRDFLKFAKLASQGKKRFTISHSSQETTYASTTETANYLLRSLGVERRRRASASGALPQLSVASAGQWMVFGFEGTSGKEHMQHLHHIDQFWNTVFAQ